MLWVFLFVAHIVMARSLGKYKRGDLPLARPAKRARVVPSASASAALAALARQAANKLATATVQSLTSSSAPLTGQFDYKTDYAKRRFPKWKRRKFYYKRKFNRRILNLVRTSNVGSTHIVRRSLGLLLSATNQSDFTCFGMYGLNGDGAETLNTTNDVGEIFKEMDATSWAGVNNNTVQGQNHKLYFYHATAEYTIRNTHATNDAIIEAYFIRGKAPVNYALYSSPTVAYDQGFNKQSLASDPNTGSTFDTQLTSKMIGVTPFQNAQFCRNYKIYRRQKFRLPPGNEISFVIHERRPRTFTMDRARTFSTDRNYHGVLFQQQGPPTGIDPPTAAIPTSVSYMCVRRYRLKMFRDNLPKDAFETTDP